MTYIKSNNNQYGAFGEQITSHKTPVVQIANKYKIDPANLTDTLEIFEATGGSADNNGNLFRCQSGTSVGGYGVVRGKETLNYTAGQGIECLITSSFTTGIANSLQFGGMFSLTETLAFGYDGANFSILHSYGGEAEVQKITVLATGAGTCTVTLDGDAVGITVTNSSNAQNANEIEAGLKGDATLSGKWRFEQIDTAVYCIAKSVGDKTGTMSVSGGVTASIAEQTAGVAKTDNHTAQASWNITTAPFSGFDPTKLNLYRVRYGYLGAANITYSIYDPNRGNFVDVHQIEWANTVNIANLGNPNIKIGWTSASLGSSGTNLTVQGASAGLFLEGDDIKSNDVHAIDNTKTSVGTTATNLATLKNRIIYADEFNLGKIFPIRTTVAIEHNKNAIVEIYKNTTLGGTTNYQLHDEYNSIAAYDTAGTTISGGELIDAFTIAANGEEVIDLSVLLVKLFPEDTLTISARTVSGTSTNMVVTLTWKEEK